MIQRIHEYLDRSKRETWQYELAARMLLEAILLIACAAPLIREWRSGLANGIVIGWKLRHTWYQAQAKSITIRGRESGHIIRALPPHKEKILTVAEQNDSVMSWIMPGLVTGIQGAENGLTLVMGLSLGATFVRLIWERCIVPAWRKSRLTHKALRDVHLLAQEIGRTHREGQTADVTYLETTNPQAIAWAQEHARNEGSKNG